MEKRDIDIKEIIKDVREDIIFASLTPEAIDKWKKSPKERHDLYKREKDSSIDAERYPSTIESYKNYGCFLFMEEEKATSGKYFVGKDHYVYYCKEDGDKEKAVKLSADLLTNEEQIKEAVRKYKDELSDKDEKVLEAFYRVAYTIGNFCLTWMNPGGARGSDICWRKLANNDEFAKKKLEKGESLKIDERENIESTLNERKFEGLFMILPLENSKEVIKRLYFQDFYDYNWKLRCSTQNVNNIEEKEELMKFIKELTILIVQRSYRIIYHRTGNRLTTQDQTNIKAVLKEVGLDDVKCIYSPKVRDCK